MAGFGWTPTTPGLPQSATCPIGLAEQMADQAEAAKKNRESQILRGDLPVLQKHNISNSPYSPTYLENRL